MNEREIYTGALEKQSPAERAAFLDGACLGDESFRQRLEALLREHDELGSFLESPPAAAPGASPTIAHSPPERPGFVIGPYKLREQIGEGGMGVVYVAEQSHPVRRKVALKVIKPGMDTKQVVARFEAERQALAMMDHPNIAKVHDGGTTESGRPYFVMELVPGVPITEYCDGERLSVRQRLELFVLVCRAVQHAHQKGIIHRDLKPSNILVTLHDGVPVPKVIDFGVAKATGQSLTEKTVYTALSQLVGTPLYMSPEQAEMNQLGVDTRSDVYSLGVLLYELLTGTTPFDKETLGGSGLEEMRRMIREDEPPRPSARVSTLQALALSTSSQRRPTDPRRVSAALRGELDWIVMKSLEKDRSRRYESASAFATDIQRYLTDEPVLACPPSTMYKFHKFARKHKTALATAVAIGTSLILGTTASAWQAVRATTAEAQANANATQAQASSQEAKEKTQEANTQRDEARRQRDEVKALNDQLRRTLYASTMNLAKSAWDQVAVSRVMSLLEQHRPKPEEPDLRGFEWHYLHRLCHPDAPLTLNLGKYSLSSVTFSPDGKRLVSSMGGYWNSRSATDPELKMWDTETGQELFSLKGSDIVVFSPDGKRVASGVATWDDTKKTFITAEAKVWDSQTGAELLVLKGHTGDVVTLAYSPDGKRLASGSRGKPGALKIWDAATGQELRSLSGNTVSVAFSPDGKRVAYATGGDVIAGKSVPVAVKVLDAETGQRLLHLPGGGMNVAYSADGKRLAASSWAWDDAKNAYVAGMVKVWDSQSGEEIRGLNEKSDGKILFAFSPDGKRIATAGQRARVPRVKVCDTETGEELFTFQQDTDSIRALAFSPDSKCLASGSVDQTLRIWDLKTGDEIRTLKGHGVTTLCFSPDSKRLASGSWNDDRARIWDMQNDTNPITFSIQGNHGTISSDFKQLASASRNFQGSVQDKTVTIWDARSGRQALTLKGHTNMIFGLSFSPDGKRLSSGDGTAFPESPGVVKVWDLQTGQELFNLKGHTRGVPSMVFSPDGKRLASRGGIGAGNELKMWNAQTGQELFTIGLRRGERTEYWTKVVFSPDGKRLATGNSPDVKILNAEDGKEVLSLKNGGRAVAFSPDGKRLASVGSGGLKVWDAETGEELLSSLTEGTSGIVGLAFSPDGKRLAGASTGGTVIVWDAQSGHEMLTFEFAGDRGSAPGSLTQQSHNVAFSADGHRLASILWDGTVRIWDATPLPEKP